MATPYTQTDALPDCADFAACATGTVGSTTLGTELIEGGTAGTTEQTSDIPATSSRLATFMQTSGGVGATTWDSGDYVVRMNVTTAQMDLSVTGIWICRVSSACASLETVGSDTTLSTDIGGGGLFSWTISGSQQTADATDDLYIVTEITNSHSMTSRTVGITPDQTIDTPITVTETITGTATLQGSSTLAASAPQSTIIVDSWEDEDLTEYSDDTTDFAIVQGGGSEPPAIDGDFILKLAPNGGSRINSTSGLDTYPTQGDQWRVYVRSTNLNDIQRCPFAWADTSNYILIEVRWNQDDIHLTDIGGGSGADATDGTLGLSVDTWYYLDMTWDDGTLGGSADDITVELRLESDDSLVGSVSASFSGSTNLNNTGIELRGFNQDTATFYWDYYHITGVTKVEGIASLSGSASLDAVGSTAHAGQATAAGSTTTATTGTRVATGAATPAGSATATPAGTIAHPGAVTAAGSATQTAAGTPVVLGAMSAAGSGTLSATGTPIRIAVAAVDASGTLTAVGTVTAAAVVTGVSDLAGSTTLAADGVLTHRGAASPTGSAAASTSGTGVAAGQADAAGSATAAAAGTPVALGALAARGSAALQATGARVATGAATPAGSTTLDAVGALVTEAVLGQATVAGSATLSATGTRVHAASAAPLGGATASITGTPVILGVMTATASTTLAADGAVVISGVSDLAGSTTLSAAGALASEVFVDVVELEAEHDPVVTLNAEHTLVIPLDAEHDLVVALDADHDVTAELDAEHDPTIDLDAEVDS